MSSDRSVSLVIRNANQTTPDFPLSFDRLRSLTVRDIKRRLSETYSSRPRPENVKLIFAGKILKDDDLLETIFSNQDLSLPQTFHMVESRPATVPASSASPAPPAAASTAHSSQTPTSPSPASQTAAPTTPTQPQAAPFPFPAGGYPGLYPFYPFPASPGGASPMGMMPPNWPAAGSPGGPSGSQSQQQQPQQGAMWPPFMYYIPVPHPMMYQRPQGQNPWVPPTAFPYPTTPEAPRGPAAEFPQPAGPFVPPVAPAHAPAAAAAAPPRPPGAPAFPRPPAVMWGVVAGIIKTIVQVALLGIIFWDGDISSPYFIAAVVALGIFFHLFQAIRVRMRFQVIRGNQPPQNQPAQAGGQGGQDGQPADAQPPQRRPAGAGRILLSFFTSMLPSWRAE